MKKLSELKRQLSFAEYKLGTSLYSHPFAAEEIKKLKLEIKALEKKQKKTV